MTPTLTLTPTTTPTLTLTPTTTPTLTLTLTLTLIVSLSLIRSLHSRGSRLTAGQWLQALMTTLTPG
jgi:hypothetical protein